MATIDFDSVSHAFGERRVLQDVTLSLTEHRIGIVGANGSGKSTLVRLINGLITPQHGRVSVDGADVAATTLPEVLLDHHRARARRSIRRSAL